MPTYVSLVKFSQHGLHTMKDKGVERAEMVKKNAQALGGKLVQAYYCLGEYDVVAIWDFPDNKTAMKAAVMNASMGHIQITTMPAVNRDEWKSLLQETIGKKNSRSELDPCFLSLRLFGCERSYVDRDAVLHVGLDQSVVGFIDLLNGDDFDIGGDVVFPTEIKHLLGFGDAAVGRDGKTAPAKNQTECRNRQRFLGQPDEGDVPIAAEKFDIGGNVLIGRDSIKNKKVSQAAS